MTLEQEQLREMRQDIKILLSQMAEIRSGWQQRAESCPHQVSIQRSANNGDRLKELEERQMDLRLQMATIAARYGVIAGAIVSIVVGVAEEVLKRSVIP